MPHRISYCILMFIGVLVMLVPDASARRRRPTGQCYGQLSPKVLARPGVRLRHAYWLFGVPNLQRKRVRGSFREYLIYLDVWDEAAFSKLQTPEMKTEGAGFVPKMLVIPRRSETETIVFRNLDRYKQRLTSPDHGDLKNLVLPVNGREVVKLENVLPLKIGRFATYRLRSKNFPDMRSEIVFLRSSAYTRPDALGRFRLRYLPRGEHTLRVYRRGKILLERRIEIGRRRLNLKTLKLRQAQ